ncbi:hypothetical protein F383_39474 [Gossypium arboreum]|uniref:Uncharacterized protein n=1 Tax=Gossypium arboreum TaxID=29729 RepID=A0A0B0MTN3_GOSAR|nr:hypothetical protein F383_39474 [Gossypium arboreum]
MKCNTPNP